MRFLRLRQIIGTREDPGRIPVSASTWWAGVKDGRFPKPVKLGPRTTAWIEVEINALCNRFSASSGPRGETDIKLPGTSIDAESSGVGHEPETKS